MQAKEAKGQTVRLRKIHTLRLKQRKRAKKARRRETRGELGRPRTCVSKDKCLRAPMLLSTWHCGH